MMRPAIAGCGEMPDVTWVLAQRMSDESVALESAEAGVAPRGRPGQVSGTDHVEGVLAGRTSLLLWGTRIASRSK